MRKQLPLFLLVFLLLMNTMPSMGQPKPQWNRFPRRTSEEPVWERFYDQSKRDTAYIDSLHPQLEKMLHRSPYIRKEQKEVITYILWNMVYVEGGTMNMGINNNLSTTISSFFINRYEVSQDEWYVIMGENPSRQRHRNTPVDQLSWFDANRFTQRLVDLSGLPFRLPYEAEWEYAARGGKKTQGFLYAGSNEPEKVAWFRERIKEQNDFVSKDTGKKSPNELGLYDMSGNVYEWCMDWYDSYHPFTNNTVHKEVNANTYKVLRGGSFYTFEKYCTITNRYGVNPYRRDIDYGMRLVVSLLP